jgi:hypothetical protein
MIQKGGVKVGFPRTQNVLGVFTVVVVPFVVGIPAVFSIYAVKGIPVVMAIAFLLMMASLPIFSQGTL